MEGQNGCCNEAVATVLTTAALARSWARCRFRRRQRLFMVAFSVVCSQHRFPSQGLPEPVHSSGSLSSVLKHDCVSARRLIAFTVPVQLRLSAPSAICPTKSVLMLKPRCFQARFERSD